jgi:hypothetical protein
VLRVCRRRWPAVWLSACSACLVLAGCGGGGRKAAPAPKLPAPLGRSLAAQSDAVASQLAAGDACGASGSARNLQQQAIASMPRVPADLQEPLQSAVNDLVDRVEAACAATPPAVPPPPVAPPANPPPEQGKGHGHGKDHKKKKHGGDEGDGE